MANPFMMLTDWSVERPKQALAAVMLTMVLLASGGMHLKFDNSEDGFFPDDPSVDLLNEVEGEYRANIDFIRVIDDIESGDLLTPDAWSTLAAIEAGMLNDSNFAPYHYPLFGTQANNGPAGHAMQWLALQDATTAEVWLQPLQVSVTEALMATDDNLSSALANLSSAAALVPPVELVSAERLAAWDPGQPAEWLPRMDTGNNLSDELGALMGQLQAMATGRTPQQSGQIMAVTGPLQGQLGPLMGLQSVDFRAAILSGLPTEDAQDPWNSDGPVLVTLAVSSEAADYGYDIIGDVQADLTQWAEAMEVRLQSETGDEGLRTFSFAQFAENSSATIGKEIGMLTSAALVLLGVILWFNFRSVRETAYVLVLTVIAIAATYGLAGWIQFAGVDMTFNAAMNSIPVLLLAIGVDYGLHVVLRVREELTEQERRNPEGRVTLRDFDKASRRRAIRQGTVLTSIALLIAITTDVVGFLSFRLSSLAFLQVFGTVIAIGLMLIYLLSISALPSLLLMLPAKRLPLVKASKVTVGPISENIGALSQRPAMVGVLALVLLIPMIGGFQQLDVAFEQRDQLDDSVPVVQDFLLISDAFGTSRSPLYVVLDGDVLTHEGREAWTLAATMLTARDDVSGLPNGVWDVLEQARLQDPVVDGMLTGIEAGDDNAWSELNTWAFENETGIETTKGLLARDGEQTVLSFQADTLDWASTVDLAESLEAALDDLEDEIGEAFTLRLSGRSLINAQTTSDVASASVQSTAIVAVVILFMLVGIHTARNKDVVEGLQRGFVSWIPLMMVVVWVYGLMGYTGYNINSQTVTIGALSLGLGVDYAVHFTTRLEEEAEHHPFAKPSEWVARSSATTGRAMAGAALTTAGGFAVLNLSALLPLRLFGQAFVVAITLALLSSLLILPALYAPFLKRTAAKAAAAGNHGTPSNGESE
ncbi:MAG: MMPL family transporter [Candidatus Poseidonia sp.]|nr:MMPL family transporter [Poseidonia sp.]